MAFGEPRLISFILNSLIICIGVALLVMLEDYWKIIGGIVILLGVFFHIIMNSWRLP